MLLIDFFLPVSLSQSNEAINEELQRIKAEREIMNLQRVRQLHSLHRSHFDLLVLRLPPRWSEKLRWSNAVEAEEDEEEEAAAE